MQIGSNTHRLKMQCAIFSMILLSACSGQHQGMEDEQIYLNSPPLKALKVPSNMQLPLESHTYQFPQHPLPGDIGQPLDIRPQPQLLALLPDSQAYFQQREAVLQLESGVKRHELWKQLNQWLSKQSIAIIERDDKAQTLTTDWIEWPCNDKKAPYTGRYRLALQQQNGQLKWVSQLLSLRQGQITLPLSSPLYRYYTAQLFNQITTALEQQRNHLESE